MIDPPTRLRRAIHLSNPTLTARILRTHPTLLLNPDFSHKSNTSLHLAASQGSVSIVQLLISLGHDSSEISRNSSHETPLMLAAMAGHVEVARVLAETFPRCVPMKNREGRDALSLACGNPGSTGLIPILLRQQQQQQRDGIGGYSFPPLADGVHSRDAEGNTPLHHASAAGSLKAWRLLLEAGADPLARNGYDWTPLAYSQTVAAEVYMKNLVAEFFVARRVMGEGERGGTVRLVGSGQEEEEDNHVEEEEEGDDDDDEGVVGEMLNRHWSPTDSRRKGVGIGGMGGSTPKGSLEGMGGRVGHVRTRSGS